MPEYTFLITDHIKVESKVTLKAVDFEDAMKMIDALTHEENPKYWRVARLSASDPVDNIKPLESHWSIIQTQI